MDLQAARHEPLADVAPGPEHDPDLDSGAERGDFGDRRRIALVGTGVAPVAGFVGVEIRERRFAGPGRTLPELRQDAVDRELEALGNRPERHRRAEEGAGQQVERVLAGGGDLEQLDLARHLVAGAQQDWGRQAVGHHQEGARGAREVELGVRRLLSLQEELVVADELEAAQVVLGRRGTGCGQAGGRGHRQYGREGPAGDG